MGVIRQVSMAKKLRLDDVESAQMPELKAPALPDYHGLHYRARRAVRRQHAETTDGSDRISIRIGSGRTVTVSGAHRADVGACSQYVMNSRHFHYLVQLGLEQLALLLAAIFISLMVLYAVVRRCANGCFPNCCDATSLSEHCCVHDCVARTMSPQHPRSFERGSMRKKFVDVPSV